MIQVIVPTIVRVCELLVLQLLTVKERLVRAVNNIEHQQVALNLAACFCGVSVGEGRGVARSPAAALHMEDLVPRYHHRLGGFRAVRRI